MTPTPSPQLDELTSTIVVDDVTDARSSAEVRAGVLTSGNAHVAPGGPPAPARLRDQGEPSPAAQPLAPSTRCSASRRYERIRREESAASTRESEAW